MKFPSYLSLTLSALLLWSCSSENPINIMEEELPENNIDNQELRIDPNSLSLNEKDAVKVATLFHLNNSENNSRSTTALSTPIIETIKDTSSNNPLLYIVNWPTSEGFTIVSASKYTNPILAYSENGNFELNPKAPSAITIDALTSFVSKAIESQDDSMRIANALAWALYEKADTPKQSRAISYELQQKINKKIAQMKALGWTYAGNITAAGYRLPENEYKALRADAKYLTDPNYDYEEVSLCFLSDNKENAIGPLLQTSWYQDALPFNAAAPNGMAGCVPLAIAQICYYHNFPQKYNWTSVPNSPVRGIENSVITQLMNEIKYYCNPTYLSGEQNLTTATLSDASYTFRGLGFVNYNYSKINKSTLHTSITARNPVFMVGNDTGIGHAWVCDGLYVKKTNGIISVVANPQFHMVETDKETGYYDIYFTPKLMVETAPYAEYYHMNFAWEGLNDGWYYCGDDYASTPSFKNNQYIIPAKKQ